MKTKILLCLAVCAATGLVACRRMPLNEASGNGDALAEFPCQIRVRVETPASKAAATLVNDSRIASLQVLVFRENGLLESYAAVGNSSTLSLDCTSGAKIFRAFANTASLSGIRNLTELEDFVFSLDSAAPDALPMTGGRQVLIRGHGDLSIELSRMVCKIVLNDVLTRMGTAWNGARLSLSGIYLTNAVSGIRLNESVQSWANKMRYAGDCPDLLYEAVPSARAWQMETRDSLRLSRVFFAFANSTDEDDLSTSWSPRYTRLVLEGNFSLGDGTPVQETVYYPIPIAGLQANHCYVINRYTIFRPGLDSPGADARLLETEFSISVKDWDETHTIDESL